MSKRLALRYTTSLLADDTVFDSEATNQQTFECLFLKRAVVNTDVVAGKLLSGRKYSHTLNKYYNYTFTISADEIDENIAIFLDNFWSATYKYISLNNGTWGNYIEVMCDGGINPIDNLDNLEELLEAQYTLSTVKGE